MRFYHTATLLHSSVAALDAPAGEELRQDRGGSNGEHTGALPGRLVRAGYA